VNILIKYGNKIVVSSYIDENLYKKIEAERAKTGESQSGIIYSVLEAVFSEPLPEN
jgi:hypothetical protein